MSTPSFTASANTSASSTAQVSTESFRPLLFVVGDSLVEERCVDINILLTLLNGQTFCRRLVKLAFENFVDQMIGQVLCLNS